MERNFRIQTVAYITKNGYCQLSALSWRPHPTDYSQEEATLEAFSAYDLPSVEALVIYFHATAGYPVRDMCIKAFNAGNYESWPGLTYNNATSYCPLADDTIKGHMVQTRQGVRSTKPKQPQSPEVIKEIKAERIKSQFVGSGYGTKR